MKITEAFPSDYIRAADLKGRAIRLVIDRVELREVGNNATKPCVFFMGAQRGWLVGKMVSLDLAAQLGDETDDWIGKTIELYPARVPFQGKLVEAIRFRIPQQPQQPAPAPAPVDYQAPLDGLTAAQRHELAEQQARAAARPQPAPGGWPVEDEIPF